MLDKKLFEPFRIVWQASVRFEITIIKRHLEILEIDQGDICPCRFGGARSECCELFVGCPENPGFDVIGRG